MNNQSNRSNQKNQNNQEEQKITFLPQHGHYRHLRVYQVTEIIYDITFYFNPDALLDNGFNVHCVVAKPVYGDVNGDGQVGIGDIVAITNIMAGITNETTEPTE